jgi:hypothetical protein
MLDLGDDPSRSVPGGPLILKAAIADQWCAAGSAAGPDEQVLDGPLRRDGIKSAVFPKPTGDGDLVSAFTRLLHALPEETTEVAAKVTYTGLRGQSHWTQLRKLLLIASPQAVRYFFVDGAVDEDA